MAFDLGTAVASITLDVSQFIGSIQQVTGLAADTGKMFNAGLTMSRIGQSFTQNVTRPIMDGFEAVITSAGDFESSLTNVRKTMDGTKEEFKELGKWAQDLSTKIPVSANELLNIGEIIGQMGVSIDKDGLPAVQKYIEIAAKLAYTTDMTSEAAANFIGRFGTMMHVGEDNLDNLGATIVDLGNKFNGTESQIAALVLRLTGAANVADMSSQGILGLAAAMVNVGLTAETGGSSMSRFIEAIDSAVATGGEELKAFAETAGMSASAFKKAWDNSPEETILRLIQHMKSVEDSGGNVYGVLEKLDIGTIRYKDTILRLVAASDETARAIETSKTAWSEASALEEEAAKRNEDFNAQLKEFQNTWENLKVEVGTALLPVLKELLGTFKDFFMSIRDNINPQTVELVAKIALLVAAIGPVLSILGNVVMIVSQLAPLFAGLGTQITGVWALMTLHPLGAFLTVLTLVVGGLVAWAVANDDLTPRIEAANSTITDFTETMSNLKPQIGDTSKMLSEQGSSFSDLAARITEAENNITATLQAALQSQQGLRQDDLLKIQQYTQELLAALTEQQSIYAAQQKAELTKLQLELGTIDQEGLQQRLVNEKAHYDASKAAADDSYSALLTIIDQKYSAMGKIGSEEYQNELAAAKTFYDSLLSDAKRSHSDMLSASLEASRRMVGTDAEKWADLLQASKAFKADERSIWQKSLPELLGIYSEQQKGMEGLTAAYEAMDRDTTNAFLAMYYNTISTGGKVSQESQNLANTILETFGNMEGDMAENGKNMLLGLLGGLVDTVPELKGASQMTGEELLSTLAAVLRLGSPSRATYEMGDNTVQGLINGVNAKKDSLRSTAQNAGSSMITGLLNGMRSMWGQVTSWINSSLSWLVDQMNEIEYAANRISSRTGNARPHAMGLESVPYDNYYARLHKGERVLTAQENKAYTAGNSSGGNTYNFFSPKALDPITIKRQQETVRKQESLGLDIG